MRNFRKTLAGIFALIVSFSSFMTIMMDTASAAFPGDNGKLFYRNEQTYGYEMRNADDGSKTDFNAVDGTTGFHEFSWSPDGSRLAFSQNNHIYTVAADGTDKRQLTSVGELDIDPVWSPDGTTILYRSCVLSTAVCGLNLLSTDGAYNEVLVDYDYNVDVKEAKWSPDAKRIVMSIEFNHDDAPQLYLLTLEDGVFHSITDDASRYMSPAWSPDGSQIAFLSNKDQGGNDYDVYTYEAESGATNQSDRIINTTENEYAVKWSPDGHYLFLNRNNGTIPNIYRYHIASNNEALIVNNAALIDIQPISSPFVYRLANWMTQERLFTTNPAEVYAALLHAEGWVYEGVGLRAYRSTDSGVVPVYRLANWMTQERLFTTSWAEVQYAQTLPGWVYEEIAFYQKPVATGDAIPVYRLANWMTQERLFTPDYNEVQSAQTMPGWVYEGVAFYAPAQ